MTLLSDHERAQGGTVTISAEQWDKLVELLTPGYELSKMMLEQAQAQAKTPKTPEAPAGDET